MNYQRVVFGEIDTGYLAVPIHYKMCLVHTIVLDFEDSFILDALAIGGIRLYKSCAISVACSCRQILCKLLLAIYCKNFCWDDSRLC